MAKLRVAVIMGGASAERAVSLASGRKVVANLDQARYQVHSLDLHALPGARRLALRAFDPLQSEAAREAENGLPEADKTGQNRTQMSPVVPESVANGHVDLAFLALHGGAGEDGTTQGLLELLGVPYTGSGVLASALAMNKILSKKLFLAEGIPTPPFVYAQGAAEVEAKAAEAASELGFPLVVKPACQGSTVGISIVRSAAALPAALELALSHGPEVLLEQFIAGTEITAGLLGNRDPEVLPLVEIVPSSGFYDYEAKYTPGATEEIVPARIPHHQAEISAKLARATYRALGCQGVGRVDMIATQDEVYVLEMNTLPGLTETSLVPRAAQAAGISFPALLDRIIELALQAHPPRGQAQESQ